MPTDTSRLGLLQPVGGDSPVELREAIATNAAILDVAVRYFTGTLVNRSTVVPSPVAGDRYYATDANQLFDYVGSQWAPATSFPGDLIISAATSRLGCLLCDGSAYSRTTYAALYAAISTTYGVGDGSTTFNVPDFRSRVIVGAGTGVGLTARGLGQTGGEENHQLSEGELAAHSHGGATGSASAVSGGSEVVLESDEWNVQQIPGYSGAGNFVASASGDISGTTLPHSHSIPSDGSNTAHNNMQPFGVANVFIKT